MNYWPGHQRTGPSPPSTGDESTKSVRAGGSATADAGRLRKKRKLTSAFTGIPPLVVIDMCLTRTTCHCQVIGSCPLHCTTASAGGKTGRGENESYAHDAISNRSDFREKGSKEVRSCLK
ncbi:hypothetical protein PG985_012127 [Apiospora marii]|uniref:Uncharacterized protein n=1 Tax=Apiospora marii TaxID=335849 RepID=A0ABR1RE36_9PEZI